MKQTILFAAIASAISLNTAAQGVSHLVHEPRVLANEFSAIEVGYGVRMFEDMPDYNANEFNIRGNYLIHKHFFIGAGFNNISRDFNGGDVSQNQVALGGGIRNVFVGARSEIDGFAYFDYLIVNTTTEFDSNFINPIKTESNGREFGAGLTLADETLPELVAGLTIFNRDFEDDNNESQWGYKADLGFFASPNLQLKLKTEMSFDLNDPKIGGGIKFTF